ncbi:MCE family protein [Nocardioides dubius]|uniref:Phospholipid/cholesterol/gamma-HCH transport system substrate-binding protein n=1 Tax=Nocardioides dubius TaxID=317019 RepID=A0ABP4E7H1_9ACTN
MRNKLWKGLAGAAALVVATGTLSACDFDGAYDLPLPGSPVDAEHSYEITADFEDVMNVVPKSPVMVDDVTVGEVLDVERKGWHASVQMRVRDDIELPANAVAEIRQTSLLGEKYVSLESPTATEPVGRLGDGAHIELSETGRNPEVEEVLGALSFLLSGGGVAQLGTITHELNAVMDGRQDDLKQLFSTLDEVVGTIDDQKVDIINALEAMNRLSTTLNAERETIGDAIDAMAPAVKVLRSQQDNLVAMLTELDKLGRVGTRVIGATKDDLVAILGDLKPILANLNDAGQALPGGLSLMLSFPFPAEAREIVKGDYANAQIKLDVNLENFIGDVPLLNPGQVLDKVGKCLASGNLLGKACQAVLADLDLVKNLKALCEGAGLRNNPVCLIVRTLPDLTSLLGLSRSEQESLSRGSSGGVLNGLLGVGKLQQGLVDPSQSDAAPTDLYGRTLPS